ncbi:MAG: magnesium and cobalt transport protein CorA [Actinomycetia bacterium]|nr:magnesium and cobalt transport protein CorA [Actinomycetes bacterium]
MIRAWSYTDGIDGATDVDLNELKTAATKPERLVWVDCDDPTPDDIALLQRELGIHPVTAEDLLEAGQRTKLERVGEHFHVAAHDCELHDDELTTREVDIVFAEGWLLTVRHRGDDGSPALPIDDAVHRFERQRVEHGSDDEGFLLWALLDVMVDRWFGVSDAIDDRLAENEELVFSENDEGIPRELFDLRRALVAFRRVVSPMREVVAALLRREAECVGEQAIVHLQDVYDHVLRVIDLLESQRELLTGLLEGRLAVMSNRMNQVMKATSSWGAILIVATLIAGIYGMNFRNMPELRWMYGYPFALGTMVFVTGGLYIIFRRRHWL